MIGINGTCLLIHRAMRLRRFYSWPNSTGASATSPHSYVCVQNPVRSQPTKLPNFSICNLSVRQPANVGESYEVIELLNLQTIRDAARQSSDTAITPGKRPKKSFL